jgi:hypothetical protein
MNNEKLLENMKKRHKNLDTQIKMLYSRSYITDTEITKLKKQKLQLKDEITKLEKGVHLNG